MKTSLVVCLSLIFGFGGSIMNAQWNRFAQAPRNATPDVISRVTKVRGVRLMQTFSPPPSDAFCRDTFGSPCYSPQEIRRAYGVTGILDAGYGGAGQTIIIIDSYGSPTIAQDLKTFDGDYDLPDPPSFTILAPLGTVPFDPTNGGQVGWAVEATLDVEWAHAMAPRASIVLMTSPVNETEGVQGMPEFLYLEQYALNHNLGKIISQSWEATENTLFTSAGQKVIADFEAFYQAAAQQNVTVLAGAGDSGSANVETNGTTFYPFPTVGYPASSPFVTAVGGTSLFATESGNHQFEITWNNVSGASGGGVSQLFSEPDYQFLLPASVQQVLENHRGLPDIAFNADPYTSVLIYLSFLGPEYAGYYGIGGTSEGSPAWAGIIADLNQLAGQPLGFLNPRLYAVAGESGSFHDITFGSNAGVAGVPGYSATPGWDFTTGWGTPNVSRLVGELVKQK